MRDRAGGGAMIGGGRGLRRREGRALEGGGGTDGRGRDRAGRGGATVPEATRAARGGGRSQMRVATCLRDGDNSPTLADNMKPGVREAVLARGSI
ncbi:hypothetical protein chiPu_0015666 [Chiloscyllium punctatum]|uniref:Uncharacterized protein n=1 Tax=Chiloscyllium punctatum TaxID=137246 RepID=A0A401T3E8_CHIPU|nr:hypothetical protein [Chiloscyllium punctatum]